MSRGSRAEGRGLVHFTSHMARTTASAWSMCCPEHSPQHAGEYGVMGDLGVIRRR